MYETKEITLADRNIVRDILYKFSCDYSSHAFESLFLWQKQMQLELYLEEDFFAVKCGVRGENTWFFPCGNVNKIKKFLDIMGKTKDFGMCYVGKREKTFLQNHAGSGFQLDRDYDSDEYIYEVGGHITLQGKHYANVRTQLHKAERENNCITKPLSEVNPEEIMDILTEWSAGEQRSADTFYAEDVEREALQNMENLQMDGIVVYLDGKAFGFAMGFPLSANTFDLFAAKERKTVPGMAYYVKHELFVYLQERYAYVNIEEDLGNEGLRRMKTSLNPVTQNKMWTATVRR